MAPRPMLCLAVMRLDEIYSIETLAHGHAVVRFSWCWNPNRLGEFFDTSGAHMRKFASEERSEMIDVHGARFYRQNPTKVVVALVRTSNGWELDN